MPKMSRWQGANTLHRKQTPSGPLAEMIGGYGNDYSQQRSIVPRVLGNCDKGYRTMNGGEGAAGKHLSSLPSNGAPLKNVDR